MSTTAQGQEVAPPDVRHIQHRHLNTHTRCYSRQSDACEAHTHTHTVEDWIATMRTEGMKKVAQYNWSPCVLLTRQILKKKKQPKKTTGWQTDGHLADVWTERHIQQTDGWPEEHDKNEEH